MNVEPGIPRSPGILGAPKGPWMGSKVSQDPRGSRNPWEARPSEGMKKDNVLTKRKVYL